MQTKINEEKIIEMALILFSRQGIKSTSLYDVARACGISVKILTQNFFYNKKTLVSAIVERFLVKHSKYLQLNSSLSPNATTEMKNFFQIVEGLFNELTPPFLREIRKYYSDVWNKLVDFREKKLIPYLKENIKRGISENCYRNDFDQDIYTRIYFCRLYPISGEQLCEIDTKRVLHELHNIFMYGILNARGLRLIESK